MTSRHAGGELQRLKRIDRVCERIEEDWKRGNRPPIEASLAIAAAEDLPELLSEVLLLEWTYRRGRGERFEASEYSSRFPDQTPVVTKAWQRWLGEETPSPAAICPEAVTSAPGPTPCPACEDRSAQAPLQSGYVDWAFIGEGGMGAVYRASDPQLRRTVAVKKLHALTPSHLARFRTEAEALARLSHPHIVQVHSLEELEGQPCLVMEFVSGGSLEDRLGRTPLAPVESARLIAILARAVQAAHAKGIVHRDLKPGNVLMAEAVEGSSENILGSFPKVSDFGLAKLAGDDQKQTGTGNVLGTPHYMAPEQAEGRIDDLGPASDVLGAGRDALPLSLGAPAVLRQEHHRDAEQGDRGDSRQPGEAGEGAAGAGSGVHALSGEGPGVAAQRRRAGRDAGEVREKQPLPQPPPRSGEGANRLLSPLSLQGRGRGRGFFLTL